MYENTLENIVGQTVTAIHWSEDRVVFETDIGSFGYEVYGDCCSYSYFHDFFGVAHLLSNGSITEVETVDLDDDDQRFSAPVEDEWEVIRVYGYKFTTVHPIFGEVTSVLSFRNSSNGYYGGEMVRSSDTSTDDLTSLTDDFIGA